MIAICNVGFWIGVVMISQIGPVLVSSPLNISGTFLFLSGVAFILFLSVLLLVPETKVASFVKYCIRRLDELGYCMPRVYI